MKVILFHDVHSQVSRELAAVPGLFAEVVNIREQTDVGFTETLDTPADAMSVYGVWGIPALVVLDDQGAHIATHCAFATAAEALEAAQDPAAYQARLEAERQAESERIQAKLAVQEAARQAAEAEAKAQAELAAPAEEGAGDGAN